MNGLVVERSRLEVHRGEGPWFDSMEGVEAFSVPGVMESAFATLSVKPAEIDGAVLRAASRDEADYVWENVLGAPPDGQVHAPSVSQDHHARVEAMRSTTLPIALDGYHTSGAFDERRREGAGTRAELEDVGTTAFRGRYARVGDECGCFLARQEVLSKALLRTKPSFSQRFTRIAHAVLSDWIRWRRDARLGGA